MRRKILAAVLVLLGGLAAETSCTPQPHCPAGQHAQRAPSHQGHVWECVPDAR